VIPNVKVDSYSVYTNNPFAGAMRGFGATQVPVAYEQQMDILAEKLGIDPITFRMKNIFTVGSQTATGQTLDESIPLDKCIEEVEKRMNFIERYKGGVGQ
jgi:nicotinate dehydrogenase large molybdopterin subunit